MKPGYLIALAFCCMLANSQAADIEAGRVKAFLCSECHGDKGISNISHYPNLAGQKYDYLVMALNAYKAKVRPDPTMQIMAQNLSQTDIENLAAYFQQLDCR